MKTKIGTEVAHVTRYSDTIFKVKKSKVNLQRGGAQLFTGTSKVFRHLFFAFFDRHFHKCQPI